MSLAIPFIAGNWKMHKTAAEAEQFVRALERPVVRGRRGRGLRAVHGAVGRAARRRRTASASTRRTCTRRRAARSPARCRRRCSSRSASTASSSATPSGGSTSARRDKALQRKVPAALEAGLTPILCVGETEEERDRGDTERKLRTQVQEGLHDVPTERLHDVVIAYEPIWAIGTGKVATPEQAQEACAFCRALVADRSREAGERIRVQYGGSMKPGNAAELLALPDVDGGLIGGASLDPDDFLAIVDAASPSFPSPRSSSSTGGASPRPGRGTRSTWRRRRSSTSCGRATRTRS